MFKKISCVALGAVATSLISAVEPAQAFSFSSSGYNSSPTSGSVSSFGSQSAGFGQSSFGSGSPQLLSQSDGGSTSVGSTAGVVDIALIVLALWAMFEGLDTTDGGGNKNVGIGDGFVNPPGIPGGGGGGEVDGGGGMGGGGDKPPAPVPTPALLPGLFGMGVAAVRKRNNLAQADQA